MCTDNDDKKKFAFIFTRQWINTENKIIYVYRLSWTESVKKASDGYWFQAMKQKQHTWKKWVKIQSTCKYKSNKLRCQIANGHQSQSQPNIAKSFSLYVLMENVYVNGGSNAKKNSFHHIYYYICLWYSKCSWNRVEKDISVEKSGNNRITLDKHRAHDKT